MLGWAIATLTPAQYEATATLVIGTLNTVDPTLPEVEAAIETAPTAAALATRGPRLEALIDELDLQLSADELDRDVYSRAIPGQPLITITAVAPTPAQAEAIANGMAAMAADSSLSSGPADAVVGIADPAIAAPEPAWPTSLRYVLAGVVASIAVGWLLFLRSPEPPTARSALGRPAPRGFSIGILLGVGLLAGLALDASDVALAILGGAALVLAVASPASALPTLLMILPFPEIDAFEPVGLSYLLVAALAVGAVVHRAVERRWPSLSVPVVMLTAFGAIVAIDAIPAITGLDGDAARDAASRVLNVIAGVITFLIVASILREIRLGAYLAVAVGSIALAGSVATLHALTGGLGPLSTQQLIAIPDATTLARATGTFTNANYAGAAMAAGLVLAIGLLRNRGEVRIVSLLAIVPIAAALILSFSRGALIAAAAGLIVTIWLVRRRFALAAGVAVVVVGVLVYPLVLQTRYERSGGFATVRAVERVSDSDAMRFEASLSSFELWAREPIIGIGGGQFPHKSPRVLEETTVTYPHNEYFAVIAEHGLVGAGLLAVGLVALILRLQSVTGYVRPVALAVITTFAVSAAFTQPLGTFQVFGMGWVLLGMAASRPTRGPGTRASLLQSVRA